MNKSRSMKAPIVKTSSHLLSSFVRGFLVGGIGNVVDESLFPSSAQQSEDEVKVMQKSKRKKLVSATRTMTVVK